MRLPFLFSLSSLLSCIAFALTSPALATDSCAKHLTTTCNSCHTIEEPCKLLGKPAEEWNSLLDRMRINGAEIGKAAAGQMAACMSQPSDPAKKICGK